MELISKIHLDWKRRVARDLAPFGVSPKQVFLLRKLHESGGLPPSEIAVLLHADRPSATSMIDTLERAGWVSRRRHAGDRRQVVVELTPAGLDKLRSVPERLWRSGKTALDPEACLSEEERHQLTTFLTRMHAAIVAADQKG